MRVLYFANDLAYFRAHRENVALAMAYQGKEVFVASGDWRDTSVSDWPSNMQLIPLELNKHQLDAKSDIKLVQELRAIIKSKRPDIVHAITIKPILICAVATRKLKPDRFSPTVRMVWTFPGVGKIFEPTTNIFKLARKFFVTQVLKFCAKKAEVTATFENSEDRDLLVEKLGILPENTHVLFGAGISLKHFTTKPESRQNDEKRPVVLMATRLIKEKGVDVFLEAAAALMDHSARPNFLLAGTRDLSNPDCINQEIIDKSVAAGHIEFLGSVAQEEMPALYQKTSVFCLPTRLREGFPRSLIEAAACGCALIAPDQKSIRQIVQQQKTGWLLRKPDREHLINALNAALSDLLETKMMGARAHSVVVSMQATDEAIITHFERVYNQATRHAINTSRMYGGVS